MTIGFDISDLATGRADGTTRYTYELAQRFTRIAPDETWLYFSSNQPTADYSLADTPATIITSSWQKYWTQLRLPIDLYHYRPDVLFMPIQQLPIIRPKLKTIAVIHDLAVHTYPEQFTYKDWALLHTFSAQAARQADHIIAVSQATADDIARYYGRTTNVHVIHHGVDHNQFYQPTKAGLAPSWQQLATAYPQLRAPYVLYVGQLQPRKNLGRLVEAFEQLAHGYADLTLVVAGSHGWLQQPILETIQQSPVRDRIFLLGRVPDHLLAPLYWHADVFVLPSLYEGFGMPIIEAMACGTPVVTANVSSMPEIAGGAAALVDPNNSSSIAVGIERARENQIELRERGLRQAQKFNWDVTAQATTNILLT